MKKPRINYLEQIVCFWRVNNTQDFNATEIATYFYLLEVNNSCGWRKSFSHNNKKIQATIGVSFKTMKAAILKLKESGLIEYKTQNGNVNIEYQIITLSKSPKVIDEVLDEGSEEVVDDISKTKEKQNNIKRDVDEINSAYKKNIASAEYEKWRDLIYATYKLEKGALEKLLNEFVTSEKTLFREPHKDVKDFAIHFKHWLNVQEKNNNLDKYRSFKHRKSSGI